MKAANLFSSDNRLDKNSRLVQAGRICLTLLLAAMVFCLFVYMDLRAGYNVLDYRPRNLLPPIPIYVADFSLCFGPRLLIGSITRLFSFQLTLNQIFDICVTMNIIALTGISLIAGALLRRGITSRHFFIVFASLLFVLNPIVPQENYPAIGSYDTYWFVLFAFLLIFCRTYGFAVVAPLFCFAGMLVHYGFLFTFLPCVAAILVYDLFCAEEKSKRVLSGVSLGVTGVSSGALLVWAFFFQNKHLKMTGPEFHAYMLSRLKLLDVEKFRLRKYCGENLFPYDFFEIYFFSNRDGSEQVTMSPNRFLEIFWNYLNEKTGVEYYLKYAVMLLPFLCILAGFWLVCAKKAKGVKKLPYLCFAGIETLFFASCVFSTDLYRYGTAAMISQICLMLVMYVKKDEVYQEVLQSPLLRKKWLMAVAFIIGAAYVVLLLKLGAYLPKTADH